MRLLLRFCGFLFAAGTIVFLVAVGAGAGLLWRLSGSAGLLLGTGLQAPIMTRVHAGDGSLVAEYATQRRLYIPIQAVPKMVINAFLAAEDEISTPSSTSAAMPRRRYSLCADLWIGPAGTGHLHHYSAGRQEFHFDQ